MRGKIPADKTCSTPTGVTNGLDFRVGVFLRTVTQNWVLWYTCVPIGGFLVLWFVPWDVSHTHILFFMNLPPHGVVPHTVSHVAASRVVLPLLPAAGFTSAAPYSSQPPLLQLFPRMQVSSGLPFFPIAPPVSAPEPPSSTSLTTRGWTRKDGTAAPVSSGAPALGKFWCTSAWKMREATTYRTVRANEDTTK